MPGWLAHAFRALFPPIDCAWLEAERKTLLAKFEEAVAAERRAAERLLKLLQDPGESGRGSRRTLAHKEPIDHT